MNLDSNPTMDELRDLLRPLDDRAAHHVLWVDRGGEVHVTPMGRTWPAPKQPGPDVLDNALVYFEPFWAGNEFVGPDAADDDEWITNAFDWLVREWNGVKGSGKPAYIRV